MGCWRGMSGASHGLGTSGGNGLPIWSTSSQWAVGTSPRHITRTSLSAVAFRMWVSKFWILSSSMIGFSITSWQAESRSRCYCYSYYNYCCHCFCCYCNCYYYNSTYNNNNYYCNSCYYSSYCY